jgi:hypothetical protein
LEGNFLKKKTSLVIWSNLAMFLSALCFLLDGEEMLDRMDLCDLKASVETCLSPPLAAL